MPRKSRLSDEDRFWSYVDRSGGPDACWPWLGTKSHAYGTFATSRGVRRNRMIGAHRFALETVYGPLGDLHACHHCDNRICCNPVHLFAGTAADNVADMVQKGRQVKGERALARSHPERLPRGEQHHGARLTEAGVRQVVALATSGVLQTEIAARCGVSLTTVNNVVIGKTWRHVTGGGVTKTRRKIPKEREAEIIAAKADGATSKELAARFGVKPKRINELFSTEGGP